MKLRQWNWQKKVSKSTFFEAASLSKPVFSFFALKLAKEGKLVVAGPFMKNDRNYRGIYIFNVETIEEAKALVATDPAIKANLLEAELTPWYCTAALQETVKIHDKIAKTKM